MKNDSTNRNIRNISCNHGNIWSYSNGYNYTPTDKTPFRGSSPIYKTILFQNKITISTKEKTETKTEKGGN